MCISNTSLCDYGKLHKKKHILSKGQDITISHNKPPGLDVISSSEINPVCKAEKRKEKKD